jgi:hypothetical protein
MVVAARAGAATNAAIVAIPATIVAILRVVRMHPSLSFRRPHPGDRSRAP